MKKLSTTLFLLFIIPLSINSLFAQSKNTDDLDLNKMLMPIDSSNIFEKEGQYVWCNSAIKGNDGKYHMFYSQWAHGKRALDDDSLNYVFDGFRGWIKYSQIGYAVSDKLLGPYTDVKILLKGNYDPTRWDRFTMHNPQIREFKGKYYLYYISNSFDPNYKLNKEAEKTWLHWLRYNCTQKIAVLVADNIEDFKNGKYHRVEQPLMQPDNVKTFEITNNPSVCEGPNGKYYMIFKSRILYFGHMTHWIAMSDKPDGPFKIVSDVFTSADMSCEDPCLWYDKKRKRFYAVVKYLSKSQKLVPQLGALALITSEDGLKWTPATHTLVSLRELKFKDGRTIQVHNLERPFIITDKKGQPTALFAAVGEESHGRITKDLLTYAVHIPLSKPKK